MPSLGFLKKKKTRDSTDSPTSPVKDATTSPIFPTSSRTQRASVVSKTSTKTNPDAHQPSQSSQASAGASHKQVDSMNSPSQQAYATPQSSPEPYQSASHNVPSIQNLIHPTNANASPASYQQPQQPAKPANGGLQIASPPAQPRVTKGKYTLQDFAIQRTLGTGSFGRVHLVQSKHNQRYYAVKVLKKAQVVKMKQVEHTNDERRMLQQVKHPFLITLWGTFQDSKNLYMVMDFVEGGELFSLLRKSQVRPARFPSKLVLTIGVAFPQSGRKVLRSRSDPGPRLPARPEHHLPRPQARKPAARPPRPPENHGLRIRKRSARHHLDAVWHARLSRARSGGIKGIQQVGRLVRSLSGADDGHVTNKRKGGHSASSFSRCSAASRPSGTVGRP